MGGYRSRLDDDQIEQEDLEFGHDGVHPNPDVVVTVKSARLGLQIFTHPNDQLGRINAAKSFSMTLDGPQDKAIWFMFTLESMMQAGWRYGVDGATARRAT